MADKTQTQPNENATTNEKQPRADFNAWLIYAICLGVSLVFMFFFGLDSPIHTFNSHCDYQWFVTMGRGLVAGKVPYRDLFEQKGPIVYLVFAFASLFSNIQSIQFVIWCIEVLCVSLFLYFSYRIARKFLSPYLSLAVVPLTMMVLSTNYCRGIEGSCVEEYCLPIFAYGLLCFLDFLMDHRPATWRRSLAIGICLGILLWVKYTLWEFFLVPMLIWLIVNLVHRKFWEILRAGLIMLGGVLIVTAPIIIWFAAAGALDDLFTVYFLLNITRYSGDTVGLTSGEAVWRALKNILNVFWIGAYFILFFVWGVVCFAIQYWRQKSGWLLLIAVVPTWLVIGFFCGFIYYYLPLFTYAVLGVIYAVKVVCHMLTAVDVKIQRQCSKIITVVVVAVISFLSALPFIENLTEINCPRENYAPLMVADIIAEYNQKENKSATLFCYRISDAGFYNAAGLVPAMYYYAENSFTERDFPEMFAAFDETISSQLCDFVVTYRGVYLEHEVFLAQYYHPYRDGDLDASTLPFRFYEPGGYGENEIVVLFRN